MPTQTDRDKIKKQQIGTYLDASGTLPTNLATPGASVKQLHEETFKFDVIADASFAEIGITFEKACVVKSAFITASAALAAHASNYITVDVQKRDGAGGAAASTATVNTNTAGSNLSLAAFVKAAIPLTTTVANKTFAAGNVLTVKSTETGTPATPVMTVSVTVEYV